MRWWLLAACALSCSTSSRRPTAPVLSEQPAQLAASASAAAPPPSATPAKKATGVRLTPKVAAPCGPDYLERHATSLSDLDGDGTLDRPSIVREGGVLVVRLHEMPSFREKGSWKLPSGYLEIATPRRAASTRGDLWIRVGTKPVRPQRRSGAPASPDWEETLYHLEGGSLAPVAKNHSDLRIRIDVDGDGRVDPIGQEGRVVRALLAGDKWLALPVATPSQVHGAPMPNDQQAAVDLDGNGVRELVIERDKSLAIIEVPSLKEVWSAKGKPWKPSLLRWGDVLVLAVRLDGRLRVFGTDSKHALIAEYPDAASYQELRAAIDTQLVMTGHPWQLYDRAQPAKAAGTIHELVGRLDDRVAPFGPVRLWPSDEPGLVAVTREAGKVAIVLVDPVTRALRRQVWQSDGAVSGGLDSDILASLVDLERDGTSELVLEEIHRTAMHHGASWNTSRLRIIDGEGKPLWEEKETRTDEWLHEGGGRAGSSMRQIRVDGTHVRAFDLSDGTMPLRVRSARDEYYVLAASSKIRTVPACLE